MRFETLERASIHIALPLNYGMLENLDDVTVGRKVWRGEGKNFLPPLVYSCVTCRVIRERLTLHK